MSKNSWILLAIVAACIGVLLHQILFQDRQDASAAVSERTAAIDAQVLASGADDAAMNSLLAHDEVILTKEPSSPSDVLPGDTLIYEHEDSRAMGKVREIGHDSQGWFARLDTGAPGDLPKARYHQVRAIVMGMIY